MEVNGNQEVEEADWELADSLAIFQSAKSTRFLDILHPGQDNERAPERDMLTKIGTTRKETEEEKEELSKKNITRRDAWHTKELESISGKPNVDKRVLHPEARQLCYWDTLIVFATIAACFQAPIRTCFTPMSDLTHAKPHHMDVHEVLTMCLLFFIEICFVLDVAVGFHVGYKKLGVVVTDRALVARHYLRTNFIWDLLAALPILTFPVTVYVYAICPKKAAGQCMNEVLLSFSYFLTLLQLLKIPSAITRSRFFRDYLSDKFGTMPCDMLLLVALFIILSNFFACGWFVTMAYNPVTNGFKDWHDNNDEGQSWLTDQVEAGDGLVANSLNCWVDEDDICDYSDVWILYVNCFYWASYAGDGFDTVQTLEKLYAIIVTVVFNNFFFAFILACIISGLQKFNRTWVRRKKYRIKIDAVNEFMHKNSVHECLRREVRDFFAQVWLPQKVDFTENTLMAELPAYLKQKVMRAITRDVIVDSQFYKKYFERFAKQPENWNLIDMWLDLISYSLIPKYYIPYSYIVKQGGIGTELFFLKSGKVAIMVDDADGKEKILATYGPGSYFGDLALLGITTKRSASVLTLSNATVYMLRKEDYETILTQMPDRGHWMRQIMLEIANNYGR